MIAGRCERMNGVFEAIKGMRLAVHRDLKDLVAMMSAFADISQMHTEVCKWFSSTSGYC